MARKTKRQAQETRQHILDAAIKAFSERGVSATSLNDIAALAGVTRGAIYWHFKNKAELFNEILHTADSKVRDFETEYQTKYPDNPLYVLTETMIYILDATVSNRQWRELMEIVFHKCEFVGEMALYQEVRSQLFDECYGRLEATLGRCIAQRQLPATLHCRRAAIMLRASMSGLMENWLFIPGSFDLQADSRTLVFALIDMLRMSPMLRCEQHDAPRTV